MLSQMSQQQHPNLRLPRRTRAVHVGLPRHQIRGFDGIATSSSY